VHWTSSILPHSFFNVKSFFAQLRLLVAQTDAPFYNQRASINRQSRISAEKAAPLLKGTTMEQQNASVSNQPVAAIDVGSNTIHLVVAIPHLSNGITLEVLVDELEFVRLGAGVNATGRIAPERAERGMAVLRQLRDLAKAAGARVILGAATEVMRLAANGPEFLARARSELGLEISVISGDQEAALTFWGATSDRNLASEQPVAVADLGGGSMELALGTGRRLIWRRSLPLGSGSLHDRFISSDPPTLAELQALHAEANTVLAALALPASTQDSPLLVVCGGTATTLLYAARQALGIPEGRANLSRGEIEQAIQMMAALPAQELAERYAVESQRASILGAGTVVLAALMDHLHAPVMEISRRGIREGMILSYALYGERWLEVAQSGEG
jgi:exopolyphosphatase/pppGpp-phosphohydrolase